MGPVGAFTLILSRVMISGIEASAAQSQYATRKDSAAARYAEALSPLYL